MIKRVLGAMLTVGVVLSSASVFAAKLPIKPAPIQPQPVKPQPIPQPVKPQPIPPHIKDFIKKIPEIPKKSPDYRLY